jgi:hypothetical protein
MTYGARPCTPRRITAGRALIGLCVEGLRFVGAREKFKWLRMGRRSHIRLAMRVSMRGGDDDGLAVKVELSALQLHSSSFSHGYLKSWYFASFRLGTDRLKVGCSVRAL